MLPSQNQKLDAVSLGLISVSGIIPVNSQQNNCNGAFSYY